MIIPYWMAWWNIFNWYTIQQECVTLNVKCLEDAILLEQEFPQPSHHENGYPCTWKDSLYLEMGPWAVEDFKIWKIYITLRLQRSIRHEDMHVFTVLRVILHVAQLCPWWVSKLTMIHGISMGPGQHLQTRNRKIWLCNVIMTLMPLKMNACI